MTREQYLEMLATEPATGAQVGAILVEFGRLGVADRGERLAVSAALLGLDSLGSTTDLVMGQAGQLVAMLRRARNRAELPEITRPDEDQTDEHDGADAEQPPAVPGMTLADALRRFAITLWLISSEHDSDTKLANIGLNIEQLARGGRLPAHTCSSVNAKRTSM